MPSCASGAKHLKQLEHQNVISSWHDRKIIAGADWDQEISAHLYDAEIILLLVSADFLSSDYIRGKELKTALERYEKGEARVVPIILRPCYWPAAPFAHLQALPLGKTPPREIEPVTQWQSRDDAFASIAKSLHELALSLHG